MSIHNNQLITTVGMVLLCFGVWFSIVACGDDSNDNYSFVCPNGTAANGATADTDGDTNCASCNIGYVLSNDSCIEFSITNVANVDDGDDAAYNLKSVAAVTTAVVDSTTYLFVVGGKDNGISVFSVGSNGTLTNADNVDDSENPSYKLAGARSATTATVGNTTYLFVASEADHGISVFSVGSNGTLTNADNVDDSENPSYKLAGARSATTATVGNTTYLFVAASDDNGVSVFSVSSNGTLSNVANIDNSASADYKLAKARWVATATVGSTRYLFVAGYNDGGISVFSVGSDGTLTHTDNVDDSDDATYELSGAYALTTATIDNTVYLFVASRSDSGISVFSVGSDGILTNVDNIDDTDNTLYHLAGARSATTATIDSTVYLFVTGSNDNGVSVFSVGSGGTLTNVANINDSDDTNYNLAFARSVTTAVVDGTLYLFVAGRNDNGVSMFAIQ